MSKKKDQIVVWCTGISGSERSDYVREAVGECRKDGRPCRAVDIGELLKEVPPHLQVQPDPTALLDGNEAVLKLQRAYALKLAEERIEQAEEGELTIVSTHACFMRRGRLQSGLDMAMIKSTFAPLVDMYATVVDNCHDVWQRLQNRAQWRGYLSFFEVAIWRATEMAMTKMLADYESKPYYVLCRGDPAQALPLLASEPRAPSIYLSYPITAIKESEPELLKEAEKLADNLRDRGFVVFNPLSIKDVQISQGSAEQESQISDEDALAARKYLDSQTVSRDLQLIDQADMVVVYYPTQKMSAGVFAEMAHARDTRKPLFLCSFPGIAGNSSPFLGIFYTLAFADPPEMLSSLSERFLGKTVNPEG